MNNKRTITTREQIKYNGKISERIATHIVTGAHGYEALCIKGCYRDKNEQGELIHNSEILAENELPITCYTCYAIWHHTHEFKVEDFNINDENAVFVPAKLKDINIKNYRYID